MVNIMSDTKVRVTQEFFDDPLRVKPSGVRTWVALILLLTIAMSTCSTEAQMRENKELVKQQLEVAKKQYALDSLRFEHIKSHQK